MAFTPTQIQANIAALRSTYLLLSQQGSPQTYPQATWDIYNILDNVYSLATLDSDGSFTTITVSGTSTLTGAASFTSTVNLSAGTVSLPSLTFTGDLNTGIYHVAADHLGIVANGTRVIDITETNILIETGFGITSGTGVGNTVTINKPSGVITTASLTAAAGTNVTITLTNSYISTSSKVLASIGGYLGTGLPILMTVNPNAGSCTFVIRNIDALAALNAVLNISFVVIN